MTRSPASPCRTPCALPAPPSGITILIDPGCASRAWLSRHRPSRRRRSRSPLKRRPRARFPGRPARSPRSTRRSPPPARRSIRWPARSGRRCHSRSTSTTRPSSSPSGASRAMKRRASCARSAAARPSPAAKAGSPICAPVIGSRFRLTRPANRRRLRRGARRAPGESRRDAAGLGKVYWNAFECAPAVMPYVPPRPRRRSVQVALTATVVGPGKDDIYVDEKGQIKVQFHWDRDGRYDGQSSCWIRAMQPWGGAGWGHQFIPRVGMRGVNAVRNPGRIDKTAAS